MLARAKPIVRTLAAELIPRGDLERVEELQRLGALP